MYLSCWEALGSVHRTALYFWRNALCSKESIWAISMQNKAYIYLEQLSYINSYALQRSLNALKLTFHMPKPFYVSRKSSIVSWRKGLLHWLFESFNLKTEMQFQTQFSFFNRKKNRENSQLKHNALLGKA